MGSVDVAIIKCPSIMILNRVLRSLLGKIRVLARRVLGRRGTYILRNLISDLAFYSGITSKPTGRSEGISAIVVTSNDEDYIVPSLLSIKDLVNEYIVVDSSWDSTPNKLEELASEGLNIKIYNTCSGSLAVRKNIALSKASYKWILHWEADYIAFDSMPHVISDTLSRLNPSRYYLIYWPWIRMCVDIYHTCRDPLHIEHWLFTYHEKLRYETLEVDGRPFESLIAPLHIYKTIFIRKPLGLHLTRARSPERTALNYLFWKYRSEYEELKCNSPEELKEWVLEKALEEFKTRDLRAIGIKILESMASENLPKYVYEEGYPSILMKHIRGTSERGEK